MRTILLAVFLFMWPTAMLAQVVINPAPVPICDSGDTLQFDGSSWVCTPIGTGEIGGSGTTGTLPRFSASQTLTNSILAESGGTVTASGNLAATGTIAASGALSAASLTVSGAATVGSTLGVTGSLSAASIVVGNTGLAALDTNASHVLILSPGSDLTANRTLTLTTGDASRTLTIGGNATIDGTEVKGPSSTADDRCARFDGTSGKLVQDAGSLCVISDAGALAAASLAFFDSNNDHTLTLDTGANLTSNRTLFFDVSDANRQINLGGDLVVSTSVSLTNAGDAGMLVYQPVTTDGTFTIIRNHAGNALLNVSTGGRIVVIPDLAMGTGSVTGPIMGVGRNTSGDGAPGALFVRDKNGTLNYLWTDTSGVLRVGTALPEEDGAPSDTSGTIVGTQTSMAWTKLIDGRDTDTASALALLVRTPVYSFTYANGAYPGTVFRGITTDESPEFGMDFDAERGIFRSFNPVSAFGYTILAVQELSAQVEALRARVAALEIHP